VSLSLRSSPAILRYNIAPDPWDGFAAIAGITKLTRSFAQRCTPDRGGYMGRRLRSTQKAPPFIGDEWTTSRRYGSR
jgi:hypothetical protein